MKFPVIINEGNNFITFTSNEEGFYESGVRCVSSLSDLMVRVESGKAEAITPKEQIEDILEYISDALNDYNIPAALEWKKDLCVLVEKCHEEALRMNEYMDIVKETESSIIERSAQVEIFSCRLVKHIHVVVDESKTITYHHRRKDNGTIEVFPVCDLFGAIRYNSKAEALEVVKVYEKIRGHRVLAVTMLEALQADLLAAKGAVKVFKEFIDKM